MGIESFPTNNVNAIKTPENEKPTTEEPENKEPTIIEGDNFDSEELLKKVGDLEKYGNSHFNIKNERILNLKKAIRGGELSYDELHSLHMGDSGYNELVDRAINKDSSLTEEDWAEIYSKMILPHIGAKHIRKLLEKRMLGTAEEKEKLQLEIGMMGFKRNEIEAKKDPSEDDKKLLEEIIKRTDEIKQWYIKNGLEDEWGSDL